MEQQNEIWLDIVGYEGYYRVSSNGNIISETRTISYSDKKGDRVIPGQPIKVSRNRFNGYLCVRLNKDGVSKTFSVHTIVARAFIPNPNSYPCVNHIDGNKLNNSASNLEWCTCKHNMQHALRIGIFVVPESFRKSKCKCVSVIFPNGDSKKYESICEACRNLGCSYPEITARLKSNNGEYTFSRGKYSGIKISII